MSDLRRVTVNLNRRAQAVVDTAKENAGATETINRALVVYGWVTGHIEAGASIVARYPDGREETAVFL